MSLHEPGEEVGLHRKKLDKIFEDRLPKMEECFKKSVSDCHTKREDGDQGLDDKLLDMEKGKLTTKTFWTVIPIMVVVLLGSYAYITLADDKNDANIAKIESRVDSMEVTSAKTVTVLETLVKVVEQVSLDVKEIKKSTVRE